MELSEPLQHGGNLTAARIRFGGTMSDWLDLSTGINPNPYPISGLAPRMAALLPQAEDLDALRAAARIYYGATETCRIVAAAGTQALIQALPRLFAPGPVAILAPTYEEHAARWQRAGHSLRMVGSLEAATDAAVVIIVNPNNPTGRLFSPAQLHSFRQNRARRDQCLVVDEAFADIAPEMSLSSDAGAPGLVVLRSFGKFFGLAGLRLGFALTGDTLAKELAAEIGPWNVSGPTIEIATQALRDRSWIAQTRTRLLAEADALDALLSAAGLKIVGGTSLFRLAEHRHAEALADRLGAAHILVRRFPSHPEWLRFGLPGSEAGLRRLAAALR